MVEPGSVRLSLHQINPTVGDLAGNEALIASGLDRARDAGAQLALFPDHAITGYPPEDLLLKEHFLRDAQAAVERLAERSHGLVAVVGFPERAEDVYNAAAVLAGGRIVGVYRKLRLPNYGVFDEQRYFQFGRGGAVIDLGRLRVGLTICEDIWEPGPPATEEAAAGASLIINLSASPYHAGKGLERERMVAQRARDAQAPMAFCNLVGGQDELIFDGHSFVVDHTGAVLARARAFGEEQLVCDLPLFEGAATRLRDARHRARPPAPVDTVTELAALEMPAPADGEAPAPSPLTPLPESLEAEIYQALILGLRDYVAKNGFEHVVMGLSGGVDSALVACLAVDALGSDRVSVVVMPSPYSSAETQSDARELAARLGVQRLQLDIAPVMETYRATLTEVFAGRDEDLTEENLQARIRGNLLMALSNKFGWLVLTTGNKSEMSVGYSTLYGDSAGGFAVIKDCPKTLVYRLCEHRLQMAARAGETEPIPRSILDRPPSAELRPGQRDDDSLPPYDVLDAILEGYVERDLGRDQLVAQGLDAAVVDRVIRLVDRAEYKRRQAPPGIKITPRAFGRDRRMPITNRYSG
jgi:NAD+ synthase (glutamine-hydrolysing)